MSQIRDAITGIYKHPIHDYQILGAWGLITGPGKAIGGIVLKTTAGIIGPIAFSMKGLESELMKSKRPIAHIRRTRIAQGRMERKELSDSERADVQRLVLERWSAEYKKWRKQREQELEKHQGKRRVKKIVNGAPVERQETKSDVNG